MRLCALELRGGTRGSGEAIVERRTMVGVGQDLWGQGPLIVRVMVQSGS